MTHDTTSPAPKKPASSTLLAANVQSVIDPEWTLPDLPAILKLAPHEMLSALLGLVSEMDQQSLRLVYRTASGEMLMTQGRSPADIVGAIHLSAVLSPVFTAIANHPNIEVKSSEFVSTFEDILKNLKMVWRCDTGDFLLHEKHRFYYARGMTLFILKQSREGVNTQLFDAKLDRHIMWVGSRFNDMIPNLDVLVVGNDFSRDFIDSVVDMSVPEGSEYEDSPEYSEFVETYEQRTGYDKTGRYSILPESAFRDFRGYYPNVRVVSGINLYGGDYDYIRHAAGDDFETKLFMKTLSVLVDGLSDTEHFAGEVALAFMHFTETALRQIGELCEGYSVEDRQALFEYLSTACMFREPTQPIHVIEFRARIAAFAAPAVRAFLDASFVPEPFKESDETLDPNDFHDVDTYEEYLGELEESRRQQREEHDQHQADARSDQIIEEITELIEYWLESCDAACADDSMSDYIAKVRILAVVRGAQIDYTPEHDTYIDDIIASVDAMCRNASLINETKDLSLDMLRKLK